MASEVRGVRLRLKPGSLPRVREWAAELTRRREEVMATLRDETARVESVFLDSTADGDFLVYYMRVDNTEADRTAVEHSTHPIDVYHRTFMQQVVESRHTLELLIDFDRTRE
jgi:hypothetical protein